MKKIVQLFLLILLCNRASAQLDSVFWFVAPEISQGIDPYQFDRPIKLNIASFSNIPININISQPANSAFMAITRTIPANGEVTIDLTSYITMIENNPPNTILSKGLYIKADGLVNIYYEVAIEGVNPEVYSLKGVNALGTSFMIPGQNQYTNRDIYTPKPLNRVDIVASEDNTKIEINPSKGIIGNVTGIPFSVTLNKGETYGIAALDEKAVSHLEGTIITSNNKIAVTVTDDLLFHPNGGADLIGDQLVPVNVVGMEYIAMKGSLIDGADKIYILATENSTEVYLRGNNNPVTTINKGETYILSYPINEDALYIKTNKPVYAYQLTGIKDEFGAAVLPSIKCTGSKMIKYKRGTASTLKLNICVRSEGITEFVLNGSTMEIQSNSFKVVPGTNSEWYYTSKEIPTSLVNKGTVVSLSCDVDFHVGIFEGGASGGCSYAFFSNYAKGEGDILTNSPDNKFCKGNDILLYLENGENCTNIVWSGPNGYTASGDSVWIRNVDTSRRGKYTVTADMVSCGSFTSSIDIEVKPLPTVDLGPDRSSCEKVILDANAVYDSYLWNTGARSKQIEVTTTGNYWIEVSEDGCKNRDTVHANILSGSLVKIQLDGNSCIGDTVCLKAETTGTNILWNTGETTNEIKTTTSGRYWVEAEESTCKGHDTIDITFIPNPLVDIQIDGDLCIGNEVILIAESQLPSDILWSTGEVTDRIKLNTSDVYWVAVTKDGCKGRDTIRIEFVEKPTVDIIVEGDSCASGGVRLKAETTVSDIRWNTGATASGISINSSGTYWVLVNEKGCTNADTTNIILGSPSAAISQKGEICDKEILLRVDTEAPDVRWNTGETLREISVTASGVYEVEVGRGACTRTYATNVTINRVDINIAEEGDLCQSGTMQLIAETNASWFLWNTGSVDSVITISKQGVYTVTASNSDCETTETKAVICECDLVFPNAFDPSSVTNATFGPVENEVVTSYKMYIYDRWGKMLFETNSMTDRWDGRYKGKNLPQGAYVYLSYYTCIGFDRFYEKSGTVLLIR